MQFRDIIDTYGIPREASREIILLVKSILKDNIRNDCVQLGKHIKHLSK
jgi:hypothetical protein